MSVNRRQRGMTLLELLAVIAVIAVLAMVILLTPTTVYRRFPLSACNAQLGQVALAASVYARDNKDRFPNLDQQPGNDGPAALRLLTPYLRDPTNTFICPRVALKRKEARSWYQSKF